MLCLYIEAPFAVFRTFTAGSFRPTAEFITPSAAYGLLLNIAGIEMREDDGKSPMTLIRKDLPGFKIALGALSFPSLHSIYQQLHNYPVGTSGKEHAPLTKGSKYNIIPVRRTFLRGIQAYVCIDDDNEFELLIREGLKGKVKHRYGLPFLGDNNFLLDRIEIVEERKAACWYVPAIEGDMPERVSRLTISIDRADMSKTVSRLFQPLKPASKDIPESAWIEVGY